MPSRDGRGEPNGKTESCLLGNAMHVKDNGFLGFRSGGANVGASSDDARFLRYHAAAMEIDLYTTVNIQSLYLPIHSDLLLQTLHQYVG